MLRVRPEASFTHSELAKHLEEAKIGNLMLFGGNILRKPFMVQLATDSQDSFKVIGSMKGADTLMNQALFLGTYPGLTKVMLNYEIDIIKQYTKSF